MSEEVKRVKGVKKWAVGLVGRSCEQYAPDGLNSMQKDGEQGSWVRDKKINGLG